MTNLNDFFSPLYKKTHTGVAAITADLGTGRYAAQTEAGESLVLTGTGVNVGDKVFYDARTRAILAQAPSVVFVDILV